MQSDSELVRLSKKGDHTAFRQLVERHEQQVRATVFGMLGDVAEARDVAQEVFIRFFKSLDQFRGDAQLSTYLSRIAINLSLNELKRQQKKKQRVQFIQKNDRVLQMEDKGGGTKRSDDQDLIRKGLSLLEPDFRVIITLRLIEGYSVKETAELLKVPQGTIASRLARAQKKLRKVLNDLGYNK